MALSSDDLRFARSWIGEAESALTFQERYDRYINQDMDDDDALAHAIEESMRSQLTALQGAPSSISLPGGISASFGQNMTTLMASIKAFRTVRPVSTRTIRRPSTR